MISDTRSELTAIRDRIRALRAKAADAAATEAEAMTAAAMAAKLMQKFDLAESELGTVEDDGVIYGGYRHPRENALHPILMGTANTIARLTETKVWVRDRAELQFAGMPADVEFATYLAEMLRGAAERGWMTAFMDRPMRGAKAAKVDQSQFKHGFYTGFIERVQERLAEMAREREGAREGGTRNALVITKRGLIAAKMQADGLRLGKARRSTRPGGSGEGRQAGRAAGDRQGFGRPVGAGSSGPRAIASH